jgi:hypothetical protein
VEATMLGLGQRLVAAVATFGSFITLILSLEGPDKPFTAFHIVLMTVAVIAFGFSVGFDIRDYQRSRPKIMKTHREIRDYMFRWIEHGGKVAIFSRTLGWVEDREMREMMERKAQRGDLALVMPSAVEESRRLEQLGAEAIYYGDRGYTIRSRFTIINRERADTAVAIGRANGEGKHLVTEFKSTDDDPSFWLAQDLVEILTRYQRDTEAMG